MNGYNLTALKKKPLFNRCCAFLIFVTCVMVAIASLNMAYAWSGAVADAGNVLTTIAYVGGAVGISYCAIQYMTGSEQTANKALSRGLLILGAVAAIKLLPIFIRLGMQFGQQTGWQPR